MRSIVVDATRLPHTRSQPSGARDNSGNPLPAGFALTRAAPDSNGLLIYFLQQSWPKFMTSTPIHFPDPALRLAERVLRIEGEAVLTLIDRLDAAFPQAVALILASAGRVIVSGMGKSGHIGRKIAATLASTGTPAFFVHPAEAGHGDLGMITAADVVLAISNSGESGELLNLLPWIKRQGARLIAMTGNPDSTLARDADAHLNAGVAQEACPLNLAPTASTTAALALGDALAVALLEARGFSAEDFARSHPGGALGQRRRPLMRVREVMRTGEAIPVSAPEDSLAEAIREIARGTIGMTVIVSPQRRILGIFTDGDLRRALLRHDDLTHLRAREVMTPRPRTIRPEKLVDEAVEMMERHRINQLPVADEQGSLVGALNMHDLFRTKAI